jgi:hypothetical protein
MTDVMHHREESESGLNLKKGIASLLSFSKPPQHILQSITSTSTLGQQHKQQQQQQHEWSKDESDSTGAYIGQYRMTKTTVNGNDNEISFVRNHSYTDLAQRASAAGYSTTRASQYDVSLSSLVNTSSHYRINTQYGNIQQVDSFIHVATPDHQHHVQHTNDPTTINKNSRANQLDDAPGLRLVAKVKTSMSHVSTSSPPQYSTGRGLKSSHEQNRYAPNIDTRMYKLSSIVHTTSQIKEDDHHMSNDGMSENGKQPQGFRTLKEALECFPYDDAAVFEHDSGINMMGPQFDEGTKRSMELKCFPLLLKSLNDSTVFNDAVDLIQHCIDDHDHHYCNARIIPLLTAFVADGNDDAHEVLASYLSCPLPPRSQMISNQTAMNWLHIITSLHHVDIVSPALVRSLYDIATCSVVQSYGHHVPSAALLALGSIVRNIGHLNIDDDTNDAIRSVLDLFSDRLQVGFHVRFISVSSFIDSRIGIA